MKIDDVVQAVTGILQAHEPQINAALSAVEPTINIAAIYPFVTNNVAFGELPILMVSAERESVEWIGLPMIAQEQFELGIWGLVHHEEPRIAQSLLRALAGAVKAALNHKDRLCWEVGDGIMYFDNILPLGSINYGVGASVSSTLVPAFNASFKSNASIEPATESHMP